MKFSSNEDIEAPIGEVFVVLADFESFERSAIRRGIEVQRVGEHPAAPTVGMAWDVAFSVRGKRRETTITLTGCETPLTMTFQASGSGLDGVMEIELLALSPRRTRLSVSLELAPQTMSARLFVQSLKLAKSNLNKRFRLKVADFARAIEDRFTRLV
jgi:carbon monoxide dehydrogenase subunit G